MIPRRGLISASTSGSSFQSNFALAGLPSPLFFLRLALHAIADSFDARAGLSSEHPSLYLEILFTARAARAATRTAISVFSAFLVVSLCQIFWPPSEGGAHSCPASTRMIDSPHGQEKTSTQKEIREEVGTLDKEINQPRRRARQRKSRQKRSPRAARRSPHRARPPKSTIPSSRPADAVWAPAPADNRATTKASRAAKSRIPKAWKN